MEDNQEQPKKYGVFDVLGVLFTCAISFSIAVWLLVISNKKFEETSNSFALSGDGNFTILNLPSVVFSSLIEVGRHFQVEIAGNKFGQFMAMSAETPNLFWSVMLSSAVYLIFLVSIFLVFEAFNSIEAINDGDKNEIDWGDFMFCLFFIYFPVLIFLLVVLNIISYTYLALH